MAQSPESLRQATELALRTDKAPALPPTCRPEASLGRPDSKGGVTSQPLVVISRSWVGGGPAASEGWG